MVQSSLPNHVAIILDGNGRWATDRGLDRTRGHEHGAHAVRRSVRGCYDRGIKNLTLYAFSVANWSRPRAEIDTLMRLCMEFAESERRELVERGVQVHVIGDLDECPTPTRRALEQLAADTQGGESMKLALAMSYGGRRDMVNAMRQVAVHARTGLLIPEEIDENSIRSFLTTGAMPDPDLVIRTGGEKRLSDFLLFECAYAELFFSEVLWPDFDGTVLDDAIEAYQRRQRRFGRTAEQMDRAVG